MAKVQLCNVVVVESQTPFLSPFQFEITFECIEELKEDLEWKMIYVGSAESEEFDQVLDAVYVGPVPEGKHMFLFEADPPNIRRIPENDAIGVTVVLITCSYKDQEFIRVGYFINNEYTDPELNENLPSPPQFDKVTRNILSSEPRVTRFKINWDDTLPDTEMTEAQSSAVIDLIPTSGSSTSNTFGQSSFHNNDGGEQSQSQSQQHNDSIDVTAQNSANSSTTFHQNGSNGVAYQPDNSNSLTAMECS